MAIQVIMPKQGLQMTEGTILQWFKKEGDQVKEGDPLFEMETDKLTIEIYSPGSGTMLKLLRQEGDTVPITELVAVLGEPGEDIGALISGMEPEKAIAPSPNQGARVFATPRARMRAGEKSLDLAMVSGSGPEGLIIERDIVSVRSSAGATPLAKKQAAKEGLDLSLVSGTGPRGKIYTRDLALEPASAEDRRIPLKGMRKIIAERMRSSLDTAAQAVHHITVDMSETVRIRNVFKRDNLKLSFNTIILKAVASALEEKPGINSRMDDGAIVIIGRVHIGVAVAVQDGLLVPVLKDANRKNLLQIESEVGALAAKVKSGTLSPEDMEGGTFTVSNLGMYGLDSFTAIINQPESGILAVGAVKETPVVVDGQVEVRPVCALTLTYDHRVIDGAPAAEFLQTIKLILENPYRLM